MDFQSEEVTIIYVDHSWILRQFKLLQCSLSSFSDPHLMEGLSHYIAPFRPS